MDDFISRQAVIDTVRKIILGFFSEKDGVMTDTEKTLLSVNKAVCNGVRELPPAQPDLIAKIQNGINATNANDSYSCGMRNGMRWCMSLVDDKEPLFENCPSAQPEVLACGEGELSAQPEREKGEWIDRGWSGDGRGNSWHEWECSECKHITKGAKWNFCPNCGADMREPEDIPMEYFESGGR